MLTRSKAKWIQPIKPQDATIEKLEVKAAVKKLQDDINVIYTAIHSNSTDNSQANQIFKKVIEAIAKVRYKDGFGSKEYVPWSETCYIIDKIFTVNHDWPVSEEDRLWHRSVYDIAALLNGENPLYNDYNNDTYAECADSVYTHLVGLIGETHKC